MEITLEKIELVKDRTGVSYKEAKEALEAADGSVVDAIIAIEENVDVKKSGKLNDHVSETMAKIKELVNKGNIAKITVSKDDETIVNIPLNVGIIGAVVAPMGVVAAAIASFGFKCKVELTTDEGKVINLTEKTDSFASQVKDKSSVIVDELKDKVPGAYEKAKEAGSDVINNMKDKTPDAFTAVKEAAAEKFSEVKEKVKGRADDIDIEVEAVEDEVQAAVSDAVSEAEAEAEKTEE